MGHDVVATGLPVGADGKALARNTGIFGWFCVMVLIEILCLGSEAPVGILLSSIIFEISPHSLPAGR